MAARGSSNTTWKVPKYDENSSFHPVLCHACYWHCMNRTTDTEALYTGTLQVHSQGLGSDLQTLIPVSIATTSGIYAVTNSFDFLYFLSLSPSLNLPLSLPVSKGSSSSTSIWRLPFLALQACHCWATLMTSTPQTP